MVSETAQWGRCCPPETTLRHAKLWAAAAGISQVTEITGQDVLEVPVFVSERPNAMGDICTYGKGLRAVDAEVGAYMEALEFYFAEPGVSEVATKWGSAREIAGYEHADDAVLDFAPVMQRVADLDASLLLAAVENLQDQTNSWLPAELIQYPAPDVGQSLFGASTNGLASGNSVLEASVQALLELVERDVWSFEFVHRASRLVEPSSLPDSVQRIVEQAERHALGLKVRVIPNEYGLPFFAAFLFDQRNPARRTFNGGWACDLDRHSAVVRAVTEAAQSRLAFIHGGRKAPAQPSDADEAQREAALVREHCRGVSESTGQLPFTDIIDCATTGPLSQKFDTVVERIRQVTQKPIYRAVYTPVDAPLQVVRVVAPLLENFKETKIRVGRRLKAAIDACPAQAG